VSGSPIGREASSGTSFANGSCSTRSAKALGKDSPKDRAIMAAYRVHELFICQVMDELLSMLIRRI
jgi:hypothetical protein